jgi:tetratricopeptide (TPR) repeat protein
MKNLLIVTLIALFASACGTASEPVGQPKNANVSAEKTGSLPTISSHSQNNATAPAEPAGAKPEGASPMMKPLDVTKMTADIEKSKVAYDKNPKDETAAKALAKAYFDRASALTGVAQYRAALGDYRKGLKLDPTDEPAKKMHDEIIRIFESMGREAPKEGDEPPPMAPK